MTNKILGSPQEIGGLYPPIHESPEPVLIQLDEFLLMRPPRVRKCLRDLVVVSRATCVMGYLFA